MKIALLKQSNNQFTVPYKQDQEKLVKIKNNQIVNCNITRQRNIRHHRKFFALLNMVMQNQEFFETVEDLLHALKIEMGYCKTIKTFSGREIIVSGSINFETMGQDQFDLFYKRALSILSKLLGCDPEDLENNIIDYI